MDTTPPATTHPGQPQHVEGKPPGLRAELGLVALTLYGVGNMVGAGIYGLVGVATGIMGRAVWISFIVSMIVAGLTGLSYASLGSRYPKAAGAAYVVQRAFHRPWLTYVIGLCITCSGLTSMATASNVLGGYAQSILRDGLGLAAPAWAVVLVFLLSLAAVNFRGIRASARLNAVCTCVEVAGLLLVVAVCLPAWGGVDYLDTTSPANPGGDWQPALVLQGAVLTFFAFIGFEDLLNVSEEVRNPRRILPIALVTALVAATALYLAVAVSVVSVVPIDELAQSKAPLEAVMARAAPWCPPHLMSVIAVFAVANTTLLNYIMGSRILYGMARQGLLPAALGRVHPTRHTPHVAILVLLGLALALALPGGVKALGAATSLLLLASFILVNVSLLTLRRRPGEATGGFEVPAWVPVGGALTCAGLIVNQVVQALKPRDAGDANVAPLALAAGIVVGILVLYAALRPRVVEEAQPPAQEGPG